MIQCPSVDVGLWTVHLTSLDSDFFLVWGHSKSSVTGSFPYLLRSVFPMVPQYQSNEEVKDLQILGLRLRIQVTE